MATKSMARLALVAALGALLFASHGRRRPGNDPHRLPHQDLLPDHPRHRGQGEGALREGRASGRRSPSTAAAARPSRRSPRTRPTSGPVAVPLVATSRKRGVLTKIVGGNGDEWSGWILGVRTASPIKSAKELDGKKVGITSAGSGTDTLALWAQSEHKVTFQRVPVGGGGLVPNLLNDNLAAAVIYSPLSYQVVSEGKVRVLDRLRHRDAAEPDRRLGRHREEPDRAAPVHPEGAERALRRARVHAQQPGLRDQDHRHQQRAADGDRQDGVREDLPPALPRRAR